MFKGKDLPNKNLSKAGKLVVIRRHVRKMRKLRGETSFKRGPFFETSCLGLDHGGEFNNLLNRQLMNTPESTWTELKDPRILHGVYEQVFRERWRIERSAA